MNGARRRPLVAAALVGTSALVLGGWLGTQRSLERVQASESVAWRAHAQAVLSTNLLADVLEKLGAGKSPELRRELRDRLAAAEAELAAFDAPEAEARIRLALGDAFFELGYDDAAELQARRVLDLVDVTPGLGPRDTERALELLLATLERRGPAEDGAAASVRRALREHRAAH